MFTNQSTPTASEARLNLGQHVGGTRATFILFRLRNICLGCLSDSRQNIHIVYTDPCSIISTLNDYTVYDGTIFCFCACNIQGSNLFTRFIEQFRR